MNWLQKLFGKKDREEQGIIKIPNIWGVEDGEPFIIPRHPNVSEVFANAVQDDLNILPFAYLSHPDENVRLATISELRKLGDYHLSSQPLVDRLADRSSKVRNAAAEAIWTEPDAVENALKCLRDEIHRSGFASTMSSKEAQKGIDILRNTAPSKQDLAQLEEWVAEIIGTKYSKA